MFYTLYRKWEDVAPERKNAEHLPFLHGLSTTSTCNTFMSDESTGELNAAFIVFRAVVIPPLVLNRRASFRSRLQVVDQASFFTRYSPDLFWMTDLTV